MSGITELDSRISARIRLKQEKTIWWRVASFLAHSGDSWFWLAGLLVVWLIAGAEWHRRAAILAVGIVIQASLVLAIKFCIRRQRPPGEWGSVYRNTDPHSFPSGHATRAGVLIVLAAMLGPAWFAVLIALWAPIMSMARVTMGVHYLLDVVAGFFFGLLVGWILFLLVPWMELLAPFVF